MSTPQIIMACWFVMMTALNAFAMYSLDKSGSAALCRLTTVIFIEAGPVALALYLAGFWQ